MSASPATTPSDDGIGRGALALADASLHLRRLRWSVRATLTLGVAASVAANVLHARPNPISQIIAAWPPLALLLTVELISRVPHHRRSLGMIRIAATAVIAAIATWVSYWHLVGVAARYGETEAGAAYLLPISVDGLVMVASVSLVEITGRIRAATPGPQPTPSPSTALGPPTPPTNILASTVPHSLEAGRDTGRASADRGTLTAGTPAPNPADASRTRPRTRSHKRESQGEATDTTAPSPRRHAHHDEVPPLGERDAAPLPDAAGEASGDNAPSETPAAVAYWYRREPDLHPAEVAARIGRSERTVRRHWPPTAPTWSKTGSAPSTGCAG
ncbi:hypothetical protein B0E53_04973 [Micromonospora sp. MH33]|uniref:DUF2637 domain-containing protein n=1 Tax=Micromonospora sp. MH33 TaxID=1945509 RepID=UPI000D28BDDF|nr:DUF2637 domain-containing protein [Micromonospora sp. MH33]PSK63104.1 hypothetical protein B0E53_04973 [Micromonospora sp. MH33]